MMERFFIRLYDYLTKRRYIVLFLAIALFNGMAILSTKLHLSEDIANFLPDKGGNQRLSPIYKKISMGNEIFVSFSTRDSLDEDDRIATLIDAAENFTNRLDSLAGKKLIKKIICRIDESKALTLTNFIAANLPYFLQDEDYAHLDSVMRRGNFRSLFENNRQLMLSPMGMGIEENLQSDPFHFSLPVLQRLRQLQYNKHYTIDDGYIFTNGYRQLILFVFSANGGSETAQNTLLQKAFDEASAQVPSAVKVSCFGAPLVAVSNATQIKTDSMRAVTIASVIILIILILFFRDMRPLVYVMVSVTFGALFGLALIYLMKGQVSSIALGAGSVIVGIAINYALHYTIHLQHHPDPRKVLADIADPMVVGNITTVGAFLSLLLISAQAMRDFGLFAALALVGTILFVLCVLPHWAKSGKSTTFHIRLEKSMNTSLDKNKWLVLGCIVLTVFLAFFCNDVRFETNFNHINYMTKSQKEAFAEMQHSTTLGDKSIYHIAQGRTLNDALKAYEQQRPSIAQLKKKGVVLAWTDLWSFLPSDAMQRQKLKRWNDFCMRNKKQLLSAISTEGPRCGFSKDAFVPFVSLLNRHFTVQPSSYFQPITDNLLRESMIQDKDSTTLVSVLYAHSEKTKEVYRVLDKKAHSFVFDMQSVTGQMAQILSGDFNLVLYICGLLVFFFLWYSFGRIELSGIAFLPMAVSWIWILGIMGLFDIRFNIVNIILSTFIFGLGDDYTIFIVDGLMYEYAYHKKMLSSYKTSVFLSALFMLVGIGSLIIAAHPAVRSLAQVTIIGMFCVVVIAFILPPLIFHWMVQTKGKPRLMPITWSNLLLTVYSFAAFLIGSTLLTLYGYWLLKLHRATDAHKLRFHQALCGISRFVVRNIPGVRHEIIGYRHEDFDKPSIIICNHQSHIDLMYLLMLSPKIIVLTNQWVWNCVFYGRIIRFADFYPVANGIENCVGQLGEMLKRGYSIAVFPEGTRSVDGTMGRFHRGAFYLAEQLHCDIKPIVFHGIGHVLPKTEFLLRQGKVTVKCLPAVSPQSKQFGEGYVERSKQMRRYYECEYTALAQEQETPRYFVDAVKGNYRYKGNEVEKEVRRSLKNIEQIEALISSLPSHSQVLMLHCGVGAVTLLTALVRKDIVLCGMDEDDDKIALASHCRLVPARLTYRCGILSEADRHLYNKVVDLADYSVVSELKPKDD